MAGVGDALPASEEQSGEGSAARAVVLADVHAFARYLGMDPERDGCATAAALSDALSPRRAAERGGGARGSDLLWIAVEAIRAPLPPGWAKLHSDAGRSFFYHEASVPARPRPRSPRPHGLGGGKTAGGSCCRWRTAASHSPYRPAPSPPARGAGHVAVGAPERRALPPAVPREPVALFPPPPPFRTDWTRLVPPPVLIGHISFLLVRASLDDPVHTNTSIPLLIYDASISDRAARLLLSFATATQPAQTAARARHPAAWAT